MATEKLELTLTFERETKRTKRFAEDGDEMPAVGTLYVQKWALRAIGDPERIKLTIEPA